MSVLPAAQSSDNLRMGAAIQSEPAAAEPDPAGTLLTGRADSKGLEVLTEPGVDRGDEMSLPLVARRVKLEQDLVMRVDSVRRNTNTAHAA